MMGSVRYHFDSIQTDSRFDCGQTLFSLDDGENVSESASKLLSDRVHCGREQKVRGVEGGSGWTDGIGKTASSAVKKSDSLLIDEVELDGSALRDFDGASDDENDFLPVALGTKIGTGLGENTRANSTVHWRNRIRFCLKRVSTVFGCCFPWAAGFNQFK
ncbi:hypothetical protein GPALN_003630 [Globodera pallida]|nr:hypothetical protein GPALN_003630 [Globodera pallida]